MRFLTVITAVVLFFNIFQFNHVQAFTEGEKPTIESMSVEKKEVTVGDTVKISVKIKEYQDFGYLNLYYSSPITGKGITIQLSFNNETMAFEGSFPIQDNIEPGNYKPHMLSLYGEAITSINSSEFDQFENGAFDVNGTEGTDLIENISVDKKEVTAGDTVMVSLKTTSHLGINYMNSYFISPITNQRVSVSMFYNPETNAFEGNIPISSITESGTYKLNMLNTYEEGNNTTAFYSSYYADKFQNADFTVSGTNDIKIIESISLDKNKATVGETINFAVKLPELVGIRYINIYYSSSVTGKSFNVDLFYNSETKFFEGSLLVPDDFELGTYSLFMMGIYDTSGNTTALYSSNYDEFEKGNFIFFKEENPPVFENISVDSENVKPGDYVRINVAATDDTKLLEAYVHYISPISKNKKSVLLSYESSSNSFIGDFLIAEESEIGIWKVDSVEIKDTNQNITLIQADETDFSSGEFNVLDVTAPHPPIVNEVTDKSTSVTGTAEASSLITVRTGELVIGLGTASIDGKYSVTILKQKAGTKLMVTSTDVAGNTSEIKEVTIKDVTAPLVPTVNEVTDKSISVTGTAEAGSSITVKTGTTEIGTGTTTNEGKYSVAILKQKADTSLSVTATDVSGNISLLKEVTVKDVTAPTLPSVNEVTDTSTSVSGAAEVGSSITIKAGTLIIGTGITSNEGKYLVAIPKQKAGTKLTILATDAIGNPSEANEVTVIDVTAPIVPTVNEVTDKSISVTGTAEAGSSITVKTGTIGIGTGTTSNEGMFSLVIPKQKADTKLTVTSTDQSGNISLVKEVTVKDVTTPIVPKVSEVTNKSTSVTGTAEAGSTVVVKSGNTTLGSDTATTEGMYNVAIANQQVGTILTVTSTDTAGNVSDVTKVTVIKAIAEKTNRIAGSSRYSTAVAISQEGWATSDTVILATGVDFPDALAGGPLAYKENAPILLTKPTSLSAETELEIKRLKAKKVIILGSKGAISLEVEAKLKSMGVAVERIGGSNRFDTAALIAKRLPSNQAVIAYGFNFPDVLSISPYAAKNVVPILLTRTDKVPAETLSAMSGKTNTIIVGSTGAVNDSVMKQFPKPVRYGGKTRFDTGKEIITKLPMGTGKAYIATGRNFPDALAGSVLAARNNAPILLVNENDIPTATKDLITQYDGFSILGSQGAVGEEVQKALDLTLMNN